MMDGTTQSLFTFDHRTNLLQLKGLQGFHPGWGDVTRHILGVLSLDFGELLLSFNLLLQAANNERSVKKT